ncbi:type II 3-dehydroquinate dehydratase [Candidatus Lucifugimonas marina]|jgi:3-dehydroquinate dehydratase-2|uniref:3-dehydroquinate dehydratase n=1 Tax=Candidatus Lucifugimonas marina TaxID=3038979 RepID=A0AAJ5ZI40_9CHLR|nr:type II 3-dehydroquinate dehydratase [SAR202 cluster bacterium JH702]MDG0869900.1 type II 3-dehydroquinate dehydratase [SAR202 cluster bacterium JH639]WFG34625.1 type II 3-dehydroquinate dehydratase [SAR202 cluster bacterium JH545]WFG38553.1 type II 3-dehydroquinate dehydratase [SAR202 cluster bacterium JH1073]
MPATILVINGPNLNNLGKRDASLYGTKTLADIQNDISAKATELGVDAKFFQSNHEGSIVDFIQESSSGASGVILNAGALTQVGYSILDALLDSGLPFIEVHLSNIHAREKFRQESVFAGKAIGQMAGFGPSGYIYALDHLATVINS